LIAIFSFFPPAGEYMHGRKQPQIRWFARRMRKMGGFRHVLDIGGGRGDLAVHIAQSFPHVHVTVIDANASSLEQGQRFAESFGPGVSDRIRFLCLRITEDMDFLQEGILGNSSGASTADGTADSVSAVHSSLPAVDFVVALHACGGLSDLALRSAVQNNCKFLVCPCCYLKTPIVLPVLPRQRSPPGGDSEGEDTPITCELQQLSAADRQTLLRLAESDNRAVSLRASHMINSARLHALRSMLPPQCDHGAPLSTDSRMIVLQQQQEQQRSLRLHMFADEYSLRNMVLSLF
jgi:predicted RNA methylase